VWPFLDVQPATYRLRVLNGSNARTFRLVLLRDGHPELERITQIGTDSGLLPTPVAVPADGLALASAERADLLVDCSDLEPGSQLTLVNTAGAPFDGLATDLTAPTRADLSGAVRRTVALVEQEFEDTPNMLTMRELADASDNPDEPVITIVDQDGTTVARLRTVATHFEDATTFFPMLGGWEVWQLINLSGDTHPIHLHLDPFHILGRRPITVTVPEDGIGDHETTATVRLAPDPDDALDHAVDANEDGLKDTVRVNPNEIVELAVRFSAYSGRYMYHCHILEHEDRDMMRPIVIMPAELMPFMT
jgi:FtsP/CotA-like multicopper oxidase with cupredoxin domain